MKRKMERLAMTLAAIMLAAPAMSAERQARIEVSELYCPSCPYIAADAVKSVDSVAIMQADYDQAAQKIVFLISYDDAATTPQEIAEAPQRYGYPGRVLDDKPQS